MFYLKLIGSGDYLHNQKLYSEPHICIEYTAFYL